MREQSGYRIRSISSLLSTYNTLSPPKLFERLLRQSIEIGNHTQHFSICDNLLVSWCFDYQFNNLNEIISPPYQARTLSPFHKFIPIYGSRLQLGHVSLTSNHLSRHREWKQCPHLDIFFDFSFLPIVSKQIEQVRSLSFISNSNTR